eukprot:1320961-Prorocentrum_lima.AAC.1
MHQGAVQKQEYLQEAAPPAGRLHLQDRKEGHAAAAGPSQEAWDAAVGRRPPCFLGHPQRREEADSDAPATLNGVNAAGRSLPTKGI